MRTNERFFLVHSIIAAAISTFVFTSPVYAVPEAPYVEGEILVKYKSSASHSHMRRIEQSVGVVTKEEIPALRVKRVKINSGMSVEEGIEKYQRLAGSSIEYAEPNYILKADLFPNDPDFSSMYNLRNIGQNGGVQGADIAASEAWNTTTGSTIVVAVIDTGVDYTHPDLAANMWTNEGEIPNNGIDDDGNGYVDDYRGWDFYNHDNDPYDDYSHGTHVAGTIAAVGNNGIGVVGVCWRAKIMPLKFLGASGAGSTAEAVNAILYATKMGARIMSNSWGGGGYSQALRDAIQAADDAGVIFVAAAGNSASDNDLAAHYPSNYECKNIIAVAATDNYDCLASFSCYGLTSVDIAAPGVAILSTIPGGGYSSYSGTSMATPHVAGAAALAWSHAPAKTHAQIISDILNGSTPLSTLDGKVAAGGRLNLQQMLNPDNDTVAPAPVMDLSVVRARMARVTLSWTSTGDDGSTGKASAYDMRYSLDPITDARWDAASRASISVNPQDSGCREEATVTGLSPSTCYYFALKVKDKHRNSSAISNVATATTSAGTVVLDDNVEGGDNGWSPTGLWHRTTHRASSTAISWYYGQEGLWTYDTGVANSGTLTSQEIDLSAYNDALLTFNHYMNVEAYAGSYDVCAVDVSRDGGVNWERLMARDSSSPAVSGWTGSGPVMLTGYAGGSVRIRFSFDTVDATSNSYEGWYVDDIRIMAEDYKVEQPDPYSHRVELTVNAESFRRGDQLYLSAVVKRGVLSPYVVCDAYLAVLLPNGRELFLTPDRALSREALPFVSKFEVRDVSVVMGPFISPSGLAGGSYAVCGVLTPPQKRATRGTSLVSNLSHVGFTITP